MKAYSVGPVKVSIGGVAFGSVTRLGYDDIALRTTGGECVGRTTGTVEWTSDTLAFLRASGRGDDAEPDLESEVG